MLVTRENQSAVEWLTFCDCSADRWVAGSMPNSGKAADNLDYYISREASRGAKRALTSNVLPHGDSDYDCEAGKCLSGSYFPACSGARARDTFWAILSVSGLFFLRAALDELQKHLNTILWVAAANVGFYRRGLEDRQGILFREADRLHQ